MTLFLIGYILIAFVIDFGVTRTWKKHGTPKDIVGHEKLFRMVIFVTSLLWPAIILLSMTKYGYSK